jgi:hypothetical protein
MLTCHKSPDGLPAVSPVSEDWIRNALAGVNAEVAKATPVKSKRVVDWCIFQQIGTLIIGHNDYQKQSLNQGLFPLS